MTAVEKLYYDLFDRGGDKNVENYERRQPNSVPGVNEAGVEVVDGEVGGVRLSSIVSRC